MHTAAKASSATSRTPSPLGDGLRRVCAEYREMPGLRLTIPQAVRLFGLDVPTLMPVLGALVDTRFLARTPDGTYLRVESY
jgi:hypothetical protein